MERIYDEEKMKEATRLFIEAVGADPNDEGLIDTPNRVSKMYGVLLGGYGKKTDECVTTFTAKSDDMVTLSNIPIFSFCSHHLLPFIGTISIAYIPNDKIIGISKLARIARVHAKKLQVQEDLTAEIAKDIERLLNPQGVAVQIRAQHLCTVLRGARSHGAVMTSTHVSGIFKEDVKARNEFLETVKGNNNVFSY